MNDATTAVLRELEAARAELEESWNAVAPERIGIRPREGGWSPIETLEHLAHALGQVVRLVEKLWRGAGEHTPELDVGAEVTSRVLGLGVATPDDPVESPESVRPTGGSSPDEIWARLRSDHARLRERVREMDGRDLSGIVFPHAALGPLNLHEWPVFAAEHERRHARQILAAARTSNTD